MEAATRRSLAIVLALVASFLIGVVPAGAGPIDDGIDQEACAKAQQKLSKAQGKFLDAKLEGDRDKKKKAKKKVQKAEKKVTKKCSIPEDDKGPEKGPEKGPGK